jgi:hypothetical protein
LPEGERRSSVNGMAVVRWRMSEGRRAERKA